MDFHLQVPFFMMTDLFQSFGGHVGMRHAADAGGDGDNMETQGALGVENRITAEDIARAEVVLLVTDIEIDDPHRFRGLRTIKTSIKSFLLQPQQIVEAVKSIMKKPVVYVELP